jgi:broad specificity phosphatase PhoE
LSESRVRITFVSHGATPAVRRAAFPLNEGLEEAELTKIAGLGWSAPRVQQVLCGPERRAIETAQALGLEPVESMALRDCEYGEWRGRGLEELQVEDPDGLMAWLVDPEAAPHGGESVGMLVDRVGRWMQERVDKGHTLAVTHSSVIRAAVVEAMGAPLTGFWRVDVAPLTVTDLRFNGRVWTVRGVGARL